MIYEDAKGRIFIVKTVDTQGNKHFVEIEKQGETFFTNAVEPSSFLEAKKLDLPLSKEDITYFFTKEVVPAGAFKELKDLWIQTQGEASGDEEPTVEIAHNALSPVVNLSVSAEDRIVDKPALVGSSAELFHSFSLKDIEQKVLGRLKRSLSSESQEVTVSYLFKGHHAPSGCLEDKDDEWETLEDDWHKE